MSADPQDFRGIAEMMIRFGIYRHLGLELVSLDRDKCVMAAAARPEFANLMGMLHGTLPFALMDTACGVAFLPHTIGEAGSATAEIKVNYLRPVRPDGRPLRCEASVIHLGKTSGVSEARVFNADEKPVAVALASVARRPVGL